MKDHLIRLLLIAGLREIANIKEEKIDPTPIATPVKQIIGMLEAKYRNPIKTIIQQSGHANRQKEIVHALVAATTI
jgi:hypothetical protein